MTQEAITRSPVGHRLLTACTAASLAVLRPVFFGHAIVIPVLTLAQATQRLAADIGLVLCTDDFDLGRGLDLARRVKARFPDIPVLGCRVLGDELSAKDLQIATILMTTAGAADFVALPNLRKQYGIREADDRFRGLVLRHAGQRRA